MTHRLAFSTFFILLAGIAFLPGCSTTPAQAHHSGVNWLIENQNADGSWGSFESSRRDEVLLGTQASHDGFGLACLALGTMALQEPSRDNPAAFDAMIDGLELLLEADPVGRASGSIFYDTWAHTYILQCLAMLYPDDRLTAYRDKMAEVIEREIAILLDRQAIEGGWCYYDFGHSQIKPTGALSTSFNTAAVLVAFYDAKQAGFDISEDAVHDALDSLIRLRFPQGAYGYSFAHRRNPQGAPNKIQGSVGRAQVCNLALYLWGRELNLDDLNQGVQDLRTWHHYILIGKGRPMPHEGWYATAGYYFMFGHYYAARVIEQLPEEQRTDHADWLAQTLADLNESDGSWFDFPLYGYYKAYGTAFGVLGLEAARQNSE